MWSPRHRGRPILGIAVEVDGKYDVIVLKLDDNKVGFPFSKTHRFWRRRAESYVFCDLTCFHINSALKFSSNTCDLLMDWNFKVSAELLLSKKFVQQESVLMCLLPLTWAFEKYLKWTVSSTLVDSVYLLYEFFNDDKYFDWLYAITGLKCSRTRQLTIITRRGVICSNRISLQGEQFVNKVRFAYQEKMVSPPDEEVRRITC